MSAVVNALKSLKQLKQTKPFQAITEAHKNLMGYRKNGLFYDDLIPDESDIVQEAISRLNPHEQMDRTFRMRRALNLSLKKISLPEHEWVKPEEVLNLFNIQDIPYLAQHLEQIESEILTRINYENLAPPKELLGRNRSS